MYQHVHPAYLSGCCEGMTDRNLSGTAYSADFAQ